jgi:hypothetical protein
MALLKFSKRSRAGDRQTAHLGRSAFRLTREDKVFEGAAIYVVGMKGQKWPKRWSLVKRQFGKVLVRNIHEYARYGAV